MRLAPLTLVIAASLATSACSVATALKTNPGQDSASSGSAGPSTSDVQKLKDQLAQNARSTGAKTVAQNAVNGDVKPGVLVIGNVGSVRTLDEKDQVTFYEKSYLATAEKWHPGQPASLSKSDFTADFAGYTNVVTWAVPGFVSRRSIAAVRASVLQSVQFPSPVGAHWGSTGDLVVASSNEDGVIFVDKVLCKDAADDYKTCAAQYTRGIYDKNTGAEIDSSMKQKSSGTRIDVSTYRTLPNF